MRGEMDSLAAPVVARRLPCNAMRGVLNTSIPAEANNFPVSANGRLSPDPSFLHFPVQRQACGPGLAHEVELAVGHAVRSFLPASCMLVRVERAGAGWKLCLLLRDLCKRVQRLRFVAMSTFECS